MAFKNCKKEDLIIIARELGEKLPEGAIIVEIKKAIESNETFINDPEFVKDLINTVVEERKERELSVKSKRDSEIEIEKIKLAQLEKELEIQRLKNSNTSPNTTVDENSINDSSNRLEILLRSIKTLSLPVPTKPENFHLFFQSLEKAFITKSVPEHLKCEILINVLGEKANNVLMHASEAEIKDYKLLKDLVLKEYQPTATEILRNFQSSQKSDHESYMQFASRLSATFEYYCKVREVTDFKSLCDLTVADRIFESLDRETKAHITVRQGQEWFPPKRLAEECDIYVDSRHSASYPRFTREVIKMCEKPTYDNSARRFRENKGTECYVCKGDHFARNCPKRENLVSNENLVSAIRIESGSPNAKNELEFVNVCIDGKTVKCLCDSGAEINCVKKCLFPLKPTQENIFLTSCFGQKQPAKIATFDYSMASRDPKLAVKAALVEDLSVEAIITPTLLKAIRNVEERRNVNQRVTPSSASPRLLPNGMEKGRKGEKDPPVESAIISVRPSEEEKLIRAEEKSISTPSTMESQMCRAVNDPTIEREKFRIQELSRDVRRKEAKKYQVGDLVAIQRTQFGTGQKLRPRFHGPYRITNAKPKDRYDVEKIGIHPGPNVTSTAADLMKPWPNDS